MNNKNTIDSQSYFYLKADGGAVRTAWALAECVAQLLLLEVVHQCLAQDFPCLDATFAALAGHAERVAHFPERACAVCDCRANLGIGYSLTEADVHDANRLELTNGKRNNNENDCQQGLSVFFGSTRLTAVGPLPIMHSLEFELQ